MSKLLNEFLVQHRLQAIKEATEVPEDAGNDVINDFEEEAAQRIEIEHREEYLAKVEHRVANYEVKIINPLREGKKVWDKNNILIQIIPSHDNRLVY